MIALTAIIALVVGALVAGLGVLARAKTQAAQADNVARSRLDELTHRLATAEAGAKRVPTLEAQLATSQSAVSQHAAAVARLEPTAQRAATLETQLNNARAELSARDAAVARLQQEVKAAHQREVDTTQLLATTKEEMSKEFKRLAGELFEEKGNKLNDQQRKTLGDLLKPFDENLRAFKTKVEQSREADVEARSKLFAQISQLAELNHQLGDQAQSLTNALRGESKTRGIWGEQVLQKLLEVAGLREGINFRTQTSHHEEGSDARLIPDVVLDLPQDRAVIIDSKVSLVAYERYGAASDDEVTRAQALKDHCASIKHHIQELSGKNYPGLYGLKSVDFTLLFVPIESALMVASEAEPDLIQYALERHIALVSPNTLFTVLRTIDYIWRVEKTTRNMDKIVFRGEQMYSAARRFAHHFVDIKANLSNAMESTEEAEKALVNQRNGIIRQAEQLRAFGVKADKPMPKELVSTDNVPGDNDGSAELLDDMPELDAPGDE